MKLFPALTMLASFAAHAESDLPQPLTLSQALSFAQELHPDMAMLQAAVEQAQAEESLAASSSGLDISAQGHVRWVEPPESLLSLGRDDHRLVVQANKPLYDFGKTARRVDAAAQSVEAQQLYLQHAQLQRRHDIMAAYFDVILSDLRYARDNEDMATGFIRFDRLRMRQELGQHSEIDVLKAESEYQVIFRSRMESEMRQRITRTRLASILNRPDSIPSQLVPPTIGFKGHKLPEVETLQKQARDGNLQLRALKAELASAKAKLAAINAEYFPQINAELAAGAYQRQMGSNDRWRAGLVLDVPIYKRGIVGAKKSAQLASIARLEASVLRMERLLDQQVLETWSRFKDLENEKKEKSVKENYRELYLDRARAIYEMEVKTDLGDAMVELTNAKWEYAKAIYGQALAWEQLRILTGGAVEEVVK
ncbi:MAG: TolC family protein [Gammaproteobacteria bacterium]|nr:TolC family protein [Gammaproteobacteria bacterium]